MNKCLLLGNLTHDPEVRYTPDGTMVVEFNMGVHTTRDKPAIFPHIVAFGKTAEICREYLKKGTMALVEGRLDISEYTDTQGHKRKNTKVIIYHVELLGNREKPKEEVADVPPDDLPF